MFNPITQDPISSKTGQNAPQQGNQNADQKFGDFADFATSDYADATDFGTSNANKLTQINKQNFENSENNEFEANNDLQMNLNQTDTISTATTGNNDYGKKENDNCDDNSKEKGNVSSQRTHISHIEQIKEVHKVVVDDDEDDDTFAI